MDMYTCIHNYTTDQKGQPCRNTTFMVTILVAKKRLGLDISVFQQAPDTKKNGNNPAARILKESTLMS